jgi:ribosomal protein L31
MRASRATDSPSLAVLRERTPSAKGGAGEGSARVRNTTTVRLIAAAVAILAVSCTHETLPESGTYAARLYVERCGQCHPAYNPRRMTAAMWEAQIDAMGPRIQQAGLAPLGADDRAAILDYLRRNAGTQ